ncbi:MAG: tetratricopeptide repeat protein [Phycisphaerae bacterium]
MILKRYFFPLVAGISVLSLLSACETRSQIEPRADALRQSDEIQPRAVAISPMNERDLQRQAAWTEAIRGLGFDTGRVVVKSPPQTSDPELAARKMAEGDAARETNHKTRAVKAYAAAVRAAPDQIEPYLALGHAMNFKGKTQLAEACFRTAVDMDPNHVEAREWLARTLDIGDRRAEAIAEMEAALEVDPNHAPAHERLAIWRYYTGDPASAWSHVHASRRLGQTLPPQFIRLLTDKMPDPGA